MPMKARKQPSRSPRGLYDPGLDKDSCGVGFVVDVKGRKSRRIVDMGLQVIRNIEHRGAVGADPETGDGAGLLIQMPDDFFRRVCEDIDIALPPAHRFAVGFMYLPQKSAIRKSVEALVEKALDGLPEEFAELLDNVAVMVEDEPSAEDLESVGLDPKEDDLLGLYLGVPLTERDGFYGDLPDRVVLYRGPILRVCTTRREVLREVRDTLVHELGHHFGMEEEDMPY